MVVIAKPNPSIYIAASIFIKCLFTKFYAVEVELVEVVVKKNSNWDGLNS